MSHTITFKLQKPAHQFQAGDATGFGIRGGVKFYDRETRKDEWTNYEAVLFAKSQAQIDYYTQMLVPDSVVSVSGATIKVKTFATRQGEQSINLVLNGALLEYVVAAPSNRAPDAAQQAYQKAVAPAQHQITDDFEDSIPF
jgi:single-strand DNA-binding protein